MPLDLTSYSHEYVSGVMTLPPFGDPSRLFMPVVCVVNIGGTVAHTRTLVYRATSEAYDPVLDSANPQAYGIVVPELVDPGACWMWGIQDWPFDHGNFWFSIRTTSPDLVPSIEFQEIEPSSNLFKTTELHYSPNDFALFHHKIRVLPPVVVPEGQREGEGMLD